MADEEREEDERPRSKKRSRDQEDDEDDDKPKRRSRREEDEDEDDRPRKPPKKSKLGLILGILGGVFLLCGGGCAGVWFGYIKPAAERVKAENDRKELELSELRKKQLEELGQAQPPNGQPGDPKPNENKTVFATVTADELADNIAKYKGKTVTVSGRAEGVVTLGTEGHVTIRAGKKKARITCKFTQAAAVSKLGSGSQVEIRGEVFSILDDDIHLGKCELLKGDSSTPSAGGVISADLLVGAAAVDYKGKSVTVKGRIIRVNKNEVVLSTVRGFGVTCQFDPETWKGLKLAFRDRVEVSGTVESAGVLGGTVTGCKVVKRVEAEPEGPPIEVTATQLVEEYIADKVAADAKYRDNLVKITGEVSEAERLVYLKGKTVQGSRHSVVLRPKIPDLLKPGTEMPFKAVKVGDTITIVGRVGVYEKDFMHMNLLVWDAQPAK